MYTCKSYILICCTCGKCMDNHVLTTPFVEAFHDIMLAIPPLYLLKHQTISSPNLQDIL